MRFSAVLLGTAVFMSGILGGEAFAQTTTTQLGVVRPIQLRVDFDTFSGVTSVGTDFSGFFLDVDEPRRGGDHVGGVLLRGQFGMTGHVAGSSEAGTRGFLRLGALGMLRLQDTGSVSPVLTLGNSRLIDAGGNAYGGVTAPLPGVGVVGSGGAGTFAVIVTPQVGLRRRQEGRANEEFFASSGSNRILGTAVEPAFGAALEAVAILEDFLVLDVSGEVVALTNQPADDAIAYQLEVNGSIPVWRRDGDRGGIYVSAQLHLSDAVDDHGRIDHPAVGGDVGIMLVGMDGSRPLEHLPPVYDSDEPSSTAGSVE